MFAGPAVSAFQKRIRANAAVLKDHICKEMNELNLERCRCIPKGIPGADWRVLQEIVAADPSREKYKVLHRPFALSFIARQQGSSVIVAAACMASDRMPGVSSL